ncbi:protein translocase subunit SecD [Patescibacteria group bacterium]
MRKYFWLLILGIIVLTVLAGVVDWPKGPDLNFGFLGIDSKRELKIHRGLDLQGGSHLAYEADLGQVEDGEEVEAMDGVVEVIRNRIDAYGVSEPVIQKNKSGGKWRVIVELPGIEDETEAINLIGKTAQLDFREQKETQISKGADPTTPSAVFVPTGLTGKDFKKAAVQFNPQDKNPEISIEFTADGRKKFAEITKRNVGKPVAIFLDDRVISQPTVQQAITDGKAVITGEFALQEAKDIAIQLNAGALPVPIKMVEQRKIGATLGEESIEKSLIAGLFGLLLVALFMLIYYRLPGLLAVVSLIIYSLVVLAIYKLVPVTLTLAGIAGFILSIGMAVDANILIFERMKEELREGKSLVTAIEEGFKRAWSSIRDSNISSLITCAILYWFGTGQVRGFAITLGIGILISMFTAITITKTFLRFFEGERFENKVRILFGVKKPQS